MRALIVLCVLAVAGVAAADDRDDARREFTAGQDSDRAGDYGAAIEHYLEAYRIKPHPFAVYNIAVDYERLKQFREAERWYQKFLETASAGPQRDNVLKLIPELRMKPASLSIRTMPAGATVVIDGKRAGVAPMSVTLPGGNHHVEVATDQNRDQRDVSIEYGEPTDVVFTFSGTPGALFIFGEPKGAYIALDNIMVGEIPSTIPVQAGPHTVRVTANGYTTYETGIVAEPGLTTKVEVRMARDLSKIDTTTEPSKYPFQGAIGFVGGIDVSATGNQTYDGVLMGQWGQLGFGFLVGSQSNKAELAMLYRYYLLPIAFSPYISLGYAWGGIGDGYMANAGFRYDLSRGHVGFAILADVGIRSYKPPDMTTGGDAETATKIQYPVLVTLEATFR
ncbi:MAG: PEGA domain-containing protein [Kofleriaceae bacterium]